MIIVSGHWAPIPVNEQASGCAINQQTVCKQSLVRRSSLRASLSRHAVEIAGNVPEALDSKPGSNFAFAKRPCRCKCASGFKLEPPTKEPFATPGHRMRFGDAARSPQCVLADPRIVVALLLAESFFLTLIRLPGDLNFENFGFADTGDNLTANFLIGRGLIPAVDFGYHYGLLGLYVGRLWFGLFGQTAFSYLCAMWLINGLIVWAITRFLRALRCGGAATIAIIAMLPIALFSCYPSFSAALEALFLFHAIASEAAGLRSAALMLATAAVFAKPAIGYFYGLVLLGFIAVDLLRRGRLTVGSLIAAVSPAAAMGGALLVLVSWYFSPFAFVRTILPLTGAHAYAVEHFGFFRVGATFWKPQNPTISYYFESPAGFWLLGTATLLSGACYSILRLVRARLADGLDAATEMVLSCGTLYLVAIYPMGQRIFLQEL